MKVFVALVLLCLFLAVHSQLDNCSYYERNVSACPMIYKPTCGCGAAPYGSGFSCMNFGNRCFACNNTNIYFVFQGYCPASMIQLCPPGPKTPICPMFYSPVCGYFPYPPSWGRSSYSNYCFACNDMNRNVTFYAPGNCY